VASKTAKNASDQEGPDPEELVQQLEKLVDRLKVMYEQYFLGIQKLAPAQLHIDAERGIRDLTQMQLRNTALRYRFNALQAKFSSYNSYWRRTMREIEQGRYLPNLSRISRQAAKTGAVIPDEILASMPKRMREQVLRDRQAALAINARREGVAAELENSVPAASAVAVNAAAPGKRDARGGFVLDEEDLGSLDFDSMFASMTEDDKPPELSDVRTQPRPRARTLPPPPPGAPAASVVVGPPTRPAPIVNPASIIPSVVPPMPRIPRAGTVAGSGVAAAPIPSIPRVASAPAAVPTAIPVSATMERSAPVVRPPRAGTELGAIPPAQMRAPIAKPPTGMSEVEVKTLYDNYVKARALVGEKSDSNTYAKLMKTIEQQAPKIMAQYKSKGVEFGVVIKDNQVILKAKPK
jgi:hypothetical protein